MTYKPRRYSSGEIVFAKLKGYPWWPAKIEDESNVPQTILEAKNKKKTNHDAYTVYFFGSLDYAFLTEKLLRQFDHGKVQQDISANTIKNKYLVKAIQQALDPIDSSLSSTMKPLLPSTSSTSKDKKSANPRNAMKRYLDHIDSATDNLSANGNKIDKRCKASMDGRRLTSAGSVKPRSLMQKPRYLEVAARKSPEYEKLFKHVYGNRLKLQKLIYDKKPGEIPVSDYAKVDSILRDIEQCNMTKELLQDTKIAKVVRIGCEYAFGSHDLYNIQRRCFNMVKIWKSTLLNWRENNIDTISPSKTPAVKLVTRNGMNAPSTTGTFAMEERPIEPRNTTQLERPQIQQLDGKGDGDGDIGGITDVEQTVSALSNGGTSITKALLPTKHKERMQPKPTRLLIPPNDSGRGVDGSDMYHQTSSMSKTPRGTFLNYILDEPDDSTTLSSASMTDNQTPLPRLFSTPRSSW